ncbi:hypothetical protein [Nostoc sp.]|uniref:hypothetical protein n=1 Tax=Nostoc sp. TaxID=1180 RepID=UPI002FFB059C
MTTNQPDMISDIVYLEECLKKEPRTYNSLQLAQKLSSDRTLLNVLSATIAIPIKRVSQTPTPEA